MSLDSFLYTDIVIFKWFVWQCYITLWVRVLTTNRGQKSSIQYYATAAKTNQTTVVRVTNTA